LVQYLTGHRDCRQSGIDKFISKIKNKKIFFENILTVFSKTPKPVLSLVPIRSYGYTKES
jgi:hypothetical protein